MGPGRRVHNLAGVQTNVLEWKHWRHGDKSESEPAIQKLNYDEEIENNTHTNTWPVHFIGSLNNDISSFQ